MLVNLPTYVYPCASGIQIMMGMMPAPLSMIMNIVVGRRAVHCHGCIHRPLSMPAAVHKSVLISILTSAGIFSLDGKLSAADTCEGFSGVEKLFSAW